MVAGLVTVSTKVEKNLAARGLTGDRRRPPGARASGSTWARLVLMPTKIRMMPPMAPSAVACAHDEILDLAHAEGRDRGEASHRPGPSRVPAKRPPAKPRDKAVRRTIRLIGPIGAAIASANEDADEERVERHLVRDRPPRGRGSCRRRCRRRRAARHRASHGATGRAISPRSRSMARRRQASMRRGLRAGHRIDADELDAAQDEGRNRCRQIHALRKAAGGNRSFGIGLRQHIGERHRADRIDRRRPSAPWRAA